MSEGKTAGSSRANRVIPAKLCIHMPEYMRREVESAVNSGYKPSEYFRSLFDQARGARLPIFAENN